MMMMEGKVTAKQQSKPRKVLGHLFKFCNLHDEDFKKIKHFVFGSSSYDRTVIWLCQLADFMEAGNLPSMGEIPVYEADAEDDENESDEEESD